MNINQGLRFFSDEDLEKELLSRKETKNSNHLSFVSFLNHQLMGKKIDGRRVSSIKLKKEHIKEPDTPGNDWWGKEYDVKYLKIVFEDGEFVGIESLDELLDLNIE